MYSGVKRYFFQILKVDFQYISVPYEEVLYLNGIFSLRIDFYIVNFVSLTEFKLNQVLMEVI